VLSAQLGEIFDHSLVAPKIRDAAVSFFFVIGNGCGRKNSVIITCIFERDGKPQPHNW